MATDDVTVRSLLAAMRIDPPDDEVDEMVKSFPALRAAADSLYSPDAARFVPAFVIAEPTQSNSNADTK